MRNPDARGPNIGGIAAGLASMTIILGSAVVVLGYVAMRVYSAWPLITQGHRVWLLAAATFIAVLGLVPLGLLVRNSSVAAAGFREWQRLLPAAGLALLSLPILGAASLVLGI